MVRLQALLLCASWAASVEGGCVQRALDAFCGKQHAGMIARSHSDRWACFAGVSSLRRAAQCASDDGYWLEMCAASEPLPYYFSDDHHAALFKLYRSRAGCANLASLRPAPSAPPPPSSPPTPPSPPSPPSPPPPQPPPSPPPSPPYVHLLPPNVTLVTLAPLGAEGVPTVVASSRVRVRAELDAFSAHLELKGRVTWLYRWRVTERSGRPLNLAALALSGAAGGPSLVLQHDALAVGAEYAVACTVSAAEVAGSSTASLTLRVNTPPRSGSLVVSPPSGLEMTTRFELAAGSWVDNSLPLAFAFGYTRHPSAAAAADVRLRARGPSPNASAFLPAGTFYAVVRVSDALGAETRYVAQSALVVGSVSLDWPVITAVLSSARGAESKDEQQQLCSALAEKLNAQAPLPPAAGAHGPSARALDADEIALATEARGALLEIIARDASAHLSASAVGQQSSTVQSVVARPSQLSAASQVKAAALVRTLAGAAAEAGNENDEADATSAALVESLSSLLSTNATALAAAEHTAVSAAIFDAASSIGRGLLVGLLPGEAAVSVGSAKLNVTAARASASQLRGAAIVAPGGYGAVRLPRAPTVDGESAGARDGVDIKLVSFGRNVHADPTARARDGLAAAEAALATASAKARAQPASASLAADARAKGEAVAFKKERLRHTVGTAVFQVRLASASSGEEIPVRGLAEPIIIELQLDADTASQQPADPAARARNRACVDAYAARHAAARKAARAWLWFNGSAVEDVHTWAHYRAEALAVPNASEAVLASYGDYGLALRVAVGDYPMGGADGDALERARALGEIMSVRARVLELARACPEPAPAACTYWDAPSANWSIAGCEALPRLAEFSYGLHLLDGGAGGEDPRARTVRCACTHLTDFAGLSIPMNREELLDQIRAVRVNTFSLRDYGDALSHLDYHENPEVYDLVISLVVANAVLVGLGCFFDLRAHRLRAAREAARVARARSQAAGPGGEEAAAAQVDALRVAIKGALRRERDAKGPASTRSLGPNGAPLADDPNSARDGALRLGRAHAVARAVRAKVTERLADEHTLFAVFFSSERAYSRAQLVQIFFNVIAIELVTECMLYQPDAPADPDAPAGVEAAAEGGHEIVTYVLNSLITSAVCLPAMLLFKNLWFLYEVFPFTRCLRASTRSERSAAATRIQALHRQRTAQRARTIRERQNMFDQLLELRKDDSVAQPADSAAGARGKPSAAPTAAEKAQRLRAEAARIAAVIARLEAEAERLRVSEAKQRAAKQDLERARTAVQLESVRVQLRREQEKLAANQRLAGGRTLFACTPKLAPEGPAGGGRVPHGAHGRKQSAALPLAPTPPAATARRAGSNASSLVSSMFSLGRARAGGGARGYASLAEERDAEAAVGQDAAKAAEAAKLQRRAELAARRRDRARARMLSYAKADGRRWLSLPLVYFQVLAWLLMWFCVAFCASIIITYGHVMGKEASRSMLVSWSIALGQTFFLHEPLVIALSAGVPVVLKAVAALPAVGVYLSQMDGVHEALDSFWGCLDYLSGALE